MSEESSQEKTFAATPKRRRDAAEKGQVPRSAEVTTAFLLIAAAGVLSMLTGITARSVADIFDMSVRSLVLPPSGGAAMVEYLETVTLMAFRGLAPVIVSLGLVALAVAGIQGRGVLTVQPITPQLDRLDPLKKAKQIWGTKAIFELVKSFAKLGIVGLSVWLALGTVTADIEALGQTDPVGMLVFMRRYTARLLLSAGLAYLVLALADYSYQIWQHEKQMKMSREEVKRETKESEGDQVVKVQRRTLARQNARRRMMGAVAEADVVVTNPTHIAVALKYDPQVSHAPIVIAMGERKVAQRIKELARDAGVPTIENKPLARALFATAEVNRPIPIELFMAVAEVLAFVYRSRGAGLPAYGAEA